MNASGAGIEIAGWLALARPVLGFGVPGLRELVLVALVALALYGRTGSRLLLSTRTGRAASPWVRLLRTAFLPARTAPADPRSRSRRDAPRPGQPDRARARAWGRWPQGRLFWALALTAAAAVAALVATRVVMHSAAGWTH
jgi:hypothetical protein